VADWPVVARRPLAPLLLTVLVLAGCGRDRTRPPDLTHARVGEGFIALDLASSGLSLRIPRGWQQWSIPLPGLTSLGSGGANVAVWRYERSEPLPSGPTALARARDALVAGARRRDPSLVVSSARVVRIDGAPGVELLASERVGSLRRRVRSTHVYASGAEIVIDALAPPRQFAELDRAVFRPVVASLRLSAPQR
jgi:hypothetical protein